MPIEVLRPNDHIPHQSGWFTEPSGDDEHEVLSDDDDGTYIEATDETTGHLTVLFEDPSEFDETATVRWVRCRIRHYADSGQPSHRLQLSLWDDELLEEGSSSTETIDEDAPDSVGETVGSWRASKPGGGGWTLADVRAVGVEIAQEGSGDGRVTELFLDVEYNKRPDVELTAPTTPGVSSRPTMEWDYDDPEEDPQAAFEPVVIAEPSGGFDSFAAGAAEVDGTPTIDPNTRHAAFSPDGGLLVVTVGTSAIGLVIIDTSDWSEVPYTNDVNGVDGGVEFSPDGGYLAWAHWNSPYLTVFDTSDWSIVSGTPTLPIGGTIGGNDAAWSPDGDYLAVAHRNDDTTSLTVLDTSDWSEVSGTPTPADDGQGVAFSPDGDYLALGHRDSPYLTIIDTSDWSVVAGTPTLPDRPATRGSVAFSPEGDYLAVAHNGSPYLTVIDTSDWSVVAGTPTLANDGQGVAFSPDGDYLAVAHEDSPYLTVIDTSDWSEVPGIPALAGFGRTPAFSPDYLVATHSNGDHLTVLTADSRLVETPVYEPGEITGDATSHEIGADLDSAGTYRAYLRVKQIDPEQWSDWDSIDWDQDADAPEPPTLTASYDASNNRVQLAVTEVSGDEDADAFRIQRSSDGGDSWETVRDARVLDNPDPGNQGQASVDDYEAPPGNVDYRAFALREVETGLYALSDPSDTETVDVDITERWLKNPLDPSDNTTIRGSQSTASMRGREARFDPLGAALPIIVSDDTLGEDDELQFVAATNDEYRTLRDLCRSTRTWLYQSHVDHRYVRIVGDRQWQQRGPDSTRWRVFTVRMVEVAKP